VARVGSIRDRDNRTEVRLDLLELALADDVPSEDNSVVSRTA